MGRNLEQIKTRCFLSIAFFCLIAAMFGWMIAQNRTLNSPPGVQGDDVYFDSMAYNFAQNGRFDLDFTDPTWLEHYRDNPKNDWIFKATLDGPTAQRSPGFPYCQSLFYFDFEGQWARTRWFNFSVLALSLTVLLALTRDLAGKAAAWIVLVSLMLDFSILGTASELVSEALATSLFVIMFSLGIVGWNKRATHSSTTGNRFPWFWIFSASVFGLMTLVRSNFYAWLPQLVVLIPIWACVMKFRQQRPTRLIVCSAAFLAIVLLINLPWMQRNCQVTDGFAPLGTAGSCGMVGGYSDGSLAMNGNWCEQAVRESEIALGKEDSDSLQGKTPAQREYLYGQRSVAKARKWVSVNLEKMPKLMINKALNHMGLSSLPWWLISINAILFVVAGLGCYRYWSEFGFWIVLVWFLSVATTMLTWSHFGRYSIPIRPVLHLGMAAGTVYFWGELVPKYFSTRTNSGVESDARPSRSGEPCRGNGK